MPATKLAAASLISPGPSGSKAAGRPCRSRKLTCRWQPLPMAAGAGLGVKEARRPHWRAASRATSRVITTRSAPASPAAGPQLISNWPTPYSGSKVSRPTPASSRAAAQRSAKGAMRRTASSENGAAHSMLWPCSENSFS